MISLETGKRETDVIVGWGEGGYYKIMIKGKPSIGVKINFPKKSNLLVLILSNILCNILEQNLYEHKALAMTTKLMEHQGIKLLLKYKSKFYKFVKINRQIHL